MFAYANACKTTPLEIHLLYLGKKQIYCICKASCIISFILHKILFIS